MWGDFLNTECAHYAKIVETFKQHTNFGIPASIIKNARGVAILSVTKAGMLVSARHGNGCVLARLPDGSWSAPSAIHTSGLGAGHQLGIETTDMVIALMTDSALEAFAKGCNFSVGGNMSIAVGPLGRSAEVNATVKSFAPIYSYSHSKGLFVGVSVELTTITERVDVNAAAYGAGIHSGPLLKGDVARPAAVAPLYSALGQLESEE
ncbi:UNVERIFIED_CONTAM: SH3 domain-containing YSC84-like protein 1 [Siphonaria sp. JEL0065]|nr:SH3 domain-containing YSC84-like protein 1 [Siphonaria sp. JEL0065]